MKITFAFCACLLLCNYTLAQHKDTHAVYWIRYQNNLAFSPTISWNNDIDNRRFIAPDVQTQLIYHSRLHLKKGRWDYAAGLTLSWAFASQPENPVQHPVVEVRPVAEVNYEVPFRKWLLQQRIRMDNRFFEEDKTETIFDGSTYVMRLRYRLQARVPLVRNSKGDPTVIFRIADEIMVNHRENFFDQQRLYLSGDFFVNKNWSVEAGYIHIYQQRFASDNFLQRHVLRFSLIHKLFLYKTS